MAKRIYREKIKVGYIYRITNLINGKIYIGFTSRKPYVRFIEHRDEAKSPRMPISRAINKYGKENFLFDVIYCSEDIKYCLEVMEPYFIAHYDTYKNGYNAHLGGINNIGFKMPKEAIEKIRIANTGRKMKQSAKDAISKQWLVIFPDGKEEVIFNLVPFCEKYKLEQDNMYSVARTNAYLEGKSNKKPTQLRHSHRGFICKVLN